jgi:uridine kinase
MGSPSDPAGAVVDLTLARPAGATRVLCIDGPAGSGKTTLAAGVAGRVPGSVVVHTDELLAGWDGLPGLATTVEALVHALAHGRPAVYARWDWVRDGWAGTRVVQPGGLVVLEGVGAWSPAAAPWVTALAWVDAPADGRRARALARGDFGDRWDRWARDEAALFARDRTREHADLIVTT